MRPFRMNISAVILWERHLDITPGRTARLLLCWWMSTITRPIKSRSNIWVLSRMNVMRFIWILNYKKNRIIKTASVSLSISETLAVLLICCKTLLLPQGVFHQNDPLIHRQSAWTDQTYQITCMKTYRQCCYVCMLSPTQLASLHPGKSDSFIPSIPLLSLFADKFSIVAFIFDSSTFHSQLYQYAPLVRRVANSTVNISL